MHYKFIKSSRCIVAYRWVVCKKKKKTKNQEQITAGRHSFYSIYFCNWSSFPIANSCDLTMHGTIIKFISRCRWGKITFGKFVILHWFHCISLAMYIVLISFFNDGREHGDELKRTRKRTENLRLYRRI